MAPTQCFDTQQSLRLRKYKDKQNMTNAEHFVFSFFLQHINQVGVGTHTHIEWDIEKRARDA